MNRFLIIVCLLITSAGIAAAQTATPAPSPVDPCAEIRARAARYETQLNDWPVLARYHEANAKTNAPAKNE